MYALRTELRARARLAPIGRPQSETDERRLLNWAWRQVELALRGTSDEDRVTCSTIALIYGRGKEVVAAQVFPSSFWNHAIYLVTEGGVIEARTAVQKARQRNLLVSMGGKRFRSFSYSRQGLASLWMFRLGDRL